MYDFRLDVSGIKHVHRIVVQSGQTLKQRATGPLNLFFYEQHTC